MAKSHILCERRLHVGSFYQGSVCADWLGKDEWDMSKK